MAVEYTTFLEVSGKLGFYSKVLDMVYLNPLLKDYPELHDRTLDHEKAHRENTSRWFLSRLMRDVCLDYKSLWADSIEEPYKTQYHDLMRRVRRPSLIEQIQILLYDIMTCPTWVFKEGRRVRHFVACILLLLAFSWWTLR